MRPFQRLSIERFSIEAKLSLHLSCHVSQGCWLESPCFVCVLSSQFLTFFLVMGKKISGFKFISKAVSRPQQVDFFVVISAPEMRVAV